MSLPGIDQFAYENWNSLTTAEKLEFLRIRRNVMAGVDNNPYRDDHLRMIDKKIAELEGKAPTTE